MLSDEGEEVVEKVEGGESFAGLDNLPELLLQKVGESMAEFGFLAVDGEVNYSFDGGL